MVVLVLVIMQVATQHLKTAKPTRMRVCWTRTMRNFKHRYDYSGNQKYETTNSPIYEFKVLQNVFESLQNEKARLKIFF